MKEPELLIESVCDFLSDTIEMLEGAAEEAPKQLRKPRDVETFLVKRFGPELGKVLAKHALEEYRDWKSVDRDS